jgi:glucose-1-phosphatase
MQLKPIRNIIFDLGGVLLDLNFNKTMEAFKKLGWEEQNLEAAIHTSAIFLGFEVGKCSPQQFRDNIRPALTSSNNDGQIDDAWNAMLLGIPDDRINYLKRLNKEYQLYLLSNTNEIHVNYHNSMFLEKHRYPFQDLFIRAFYSFEMGLRKPDTAIFEQVMEETGIKPEETLFIDDLPQNTIAARYLGITALHIQAGTLLQILPEFLAKS